MPPLRVGHEGPPAALAGAMRLPSTSVLESLRRPGKRGTKGPDASRRRWESLRGVGPRLIGELQSILTSAVDHAVVNRLDKPVLIAERPRGN
jgi:hypothetical protein